MGNKMKKTIIVGATSGIGKELAAILAENGYLVGITGRRKKNLVTSVEKASRQIYNKILLC